jgi:hypothetical protein
VPDLHDLLSEVTERSPHPDPVTAVHRTVRRRAVRRRAGVAAGTTLAVTAAGVAVARPHREAGLRPAATPSVSASPTPTATATWDMARGDRMNALVKAHPDVFVGLFVVEAMGAGTTFHVVFLPGADQQAWRDDVDAAAGGAPWVAESCPGTRAHYDTLAAEIAAFDWPSGQHPAQPPYLDASSCHYEVSMPVHKVSPEDVAAARERWGDEVSPIPGV